MPKAISLVIACAALAFSSSLALANPKNYNQPHGAGHGQYNNQNYGQNYGNPWNLGGLFYLLDRNRGGYGNKYEERSYYPSHRDRKREYHKRQARKREYYNQREYDGYGRPKFYWADRNGDGVISRREWKIAKRQQKKYWKKQKRLNKYYKKKHYQQQYYD